MNMPSARLSLRARQLVAAGVLFGSVALAGCSHPEEAPSPSPTAAAAKSTNPANPPGGPQGDAAYYQKTYGGGAARPH